jgi:choline kinase
MSTISLGLILAAGNGRRLASVSNGLPKPLVELHGKPLLEHVLLAAHEAGIQKFVVVVGYRANVIRSWCAARSLDGLLITVLENPDYTRDNGVSVLKARDIQEPFALFMADHIFEPETAAALFREPVGEDETILAVDHKLDDIFDLDDATKVARRSGYVIDIGKDIKSYDAVDTGMFLCSPSVFHWLESAKKNGNCSLSDGMRLVARYRRLRAFDVGNALWQDVDAPETLAHAARIFPERSRPNQIMEEVVGV